MAAEPTIAVLSVAPGAWRNRVVHWYAAMADYWALTKPEVNFLILITTFAGFYLASTAGPGGFRILPVIHTLLGTLLVAGGTGTLNQYIERRFDAQMRRTARRPLASGRIESSHALWFGISLSLAGTVYLALAVSGLASLLAVVTLLSYLIPTAFVLFRRRGECEPMLKHAPKAPTCSTNFPRVWPATPRANASRAFASGIVSAMTGRISPESINAAIWRSCSLLGSTLKNSPRLPWPTASLSMIGLVKLTRTPVGFRRLSKDDSKPQLRQANLKIRPPVETSERTADPQCPRYTRAL
jgi:UbiA prenyltransferase family